MPSQPASAIARWNSCGKLLSSSLASQYLSPKRAHRSGRGHGFIEKGCSRSRLPVISPDNLIGHASGERSFGHGTRRTAVDRRSRR
jgi:hypothetical protein